MNQSTQVLPSKTGHRRLGPWNRLCRRLLFKGLASLPDGWLEIQDGESSSQFGRADDPLRACLLVHDPNLYGQALWGGSIGAAQSYLEGGWSSDDLVSLFRLFARNESTWSRFDSPWHRLGTAAHWIRHRLRPNSRLGSRRNIEAHYDLGNEFFQLFLDPTLTYSCGLFERPDSTLLEASQAKYERICRKLEVGEGDHVLEVGSGWGGFALHAAQHHGCRVTTATISPSQHDWVGRRIQESGLSERVQVELRDYRDLRGTYDKLVSIEMIEAVGHRYLDGFFARCSELLKDDGRMALQAIIIADRHQRRSKRSVDFIQSHVFPGSALPSLSGLCSSLSQAGLRVLHLEDITPHYPRTLRAWRSRFMAHQGELRSLGYADEFTRLWEFYFCYCEAGFLENHIGDVQMIMAKPGFSGGHP